MTDLDGTGTYKHTNIFAGGQLLATYDTAGLHFPLSDTLGTVRVQASGLGVAEESFSSLPYGDGMVTNSLLRNVPAQDATEHHFTGKERDTESGLDYFGLDTMRVRWAGGCRQIGAILQAVSRTQT